MVKFIVVLTRKPESSAGAFRMYFDEVHAPLARKMPDLVRYVRNFPAEDPHRPPPSWDAVVELHFSDAEAMEASWASPEGIAATEDLANFADLSASSWGVVEEILEDRRKLRTEDAGRLPSQ